MMLLRELYLGKFRNFFLFVHVTLSVYVITEAIFSMPYLGVSYIIILLFIGLFVYLLLVEI